MNENEKKIKKYEMRIAKLAGKAMHDYNMLSDGDRVAVAVSGGKDSLTMLHVLYTRLKWIPIQYELIPVFVKLNAPCSDDTNIDEIKRICNSMKLDLTIREMELQKAKRSKCFWCAWNRRKELFNVCEEYNCNKLAMGHHKDDIIETFMLNLFYHGEIATMPPKLDFFKGKLTMIRPLAYLEEKMTRRYALEHGFEISTCSNDFSKDSKRVMVKNLIREYKSKVPELKSNLFNSMKKEIKREYLT